MSLHQYIGARYVPLFYRNSLDPSSCEWENNVTYEPLTLVTLPNDHCYISKMTVPDTIGSPASNPDYWLETGNFNAYIQALQDQIDDLNINLDKKEIRQADRKYLFVFDSYGVLGLSTYAESVCPGGAVSVNVGGAGFCGAGGGQNWEQAVSAYLATLSQDELDSFTDVMIFGGVNDYNYISSQLVPAMTSFNTMIQGYLTDPRITVCTISYPIRTGDHAGDSYFNGTIQGYRDGAETNRWRYVDGLNAPIHFDGYMASDGIHPTSLGITLLGSYIAQFIKQDYLSPFTQPSNNVTLNPDTGWTDAGSTVRSYIEEGEVSLFGRIGMTHAGVSWIAGQPLYVGSISNSWMFGFKRGGVAPTACITMNVVDSVLGIKQFSAIMEVYEDGIYINQYEDNFTAITTISTLVFNVRSPRNCC